MVVLVQGLGSIAQKHIAAIKKIAPKADIFALRSGKGQREHEGVHNIYSLDEVPSNIDFAIISNPTNQHFDSILSALQLNVPIFIEKPALASLKEVDMLLERVEQASIQTYVACNMRFLPILNFVKEAFISKKPLEIRCYAGSYLPDWRPGYDYREMYSAKAEMGGGVHLDLIHELDYLYFLLGRPEQVASKVCKISDLEISSADYAHYHLVYPNTMASVTLNYFRKVPKRDMEIVFKDSLWSVDFLSSRIIDMSNGDLIFESDQGILDTYPLQISYFLDMLSGKEKPMNDLKEAIEVLKICLHEAA